MNNRLSLNKTIVGLSIFSVFIAWTISSSLQLAHAAAADTYTIKLVVDKLVVKRGHTQTIDAIVESKSGKPVTGTTVIFTIDYADQKTTRQSVVTVDPSSGRASYSWQIGHHVTTGDFDVSISVQGPGFETQSVSGQSFRVR